ncbi:efflux RND transporter periplasmic adaptor subunit [Microbulbifer thermotolerans]|uniref:Efflux RND transporter periplasmic adaptor subunit n=1 Tax=Microbulbifer thermotolerans TaxID=252514 RepID=A0AB35HXA0_MICTH|nr:efflux RND transporter periplasmic adaptor subunit [Microbulbifer thermotolerans]MCX2778495.1 efflux RND transporter periplasmic adaptor subunit [Microbulbifer thermotolerans]MCX2801683.1 efflux RND transporter periplasmic adaptor subunit [Microbulbifer thermotolerans]MCX2803996.1 efflux RND transporter periplasmic adaptor subunit [Microbulbifer thermotolerans]MCX2830827.1 efflux RND transporter periplasmic adaptor subunit [Microbulbifer thermotolerans]MCX2833429.1 efflux RND transporter pe
MSKNTRELLGQLSIDRDAPSETALPARQRAIAAAVGALGGLLLGALAVSVIQGEGKAPQPAIAAAVKKTTAHEIAPPAIRERETVLNASGYITARRIATVSSEVMGLISSVDVEEGMYVTEGQVLARLDDSKAKVNLAFAQAQVKVLQARQASIIANLEEARRQRIRYAGLRDKDYSSQAELTRSEATVASLQADLASARADIEVAKIEVERQREHLEDHTIRAPFSGVVTQKNAQPGEIVAPSSAGGGFTRTGICTIVDMNSLEIEVDVNEAFIGRVSPGQKVIANLDAYPDWDIPATVVAIIPTADRAKATVRVRIGIDGKDARILPDMGVKVAFLSTGESLGNL